MDEGATLDLDATAGKIEFSLPALTVLAHFSPARVGDWARLYGPTRLGRSSPELQDVDQAKSMVPLNDPFLSRKAIELTPEDEGVRIDPAGSPIEVTADGVPIREPTHFSKAQLERGVVLCLSNRVALLLHVVNVPRIRAKAHYGLVGQSRGAEDVCRSIASLAATEVPVLIRGESGVGKELIARAVKDVSARAGSHYEALNMASISESLAASELFGHEKGAFSGANERRQGCFARAHGGTLFLDEVGDTPASVQPQLLRVLETKDFTPVGATSAEQADVRVISATDANLEASGGGFRDALLHRLAGFQIFVPPLRARREDIGLLLLHFFRAELAKFGRIALIDEPTPKAPWLPARIVARLARYDWPGNVRQLRNVVSQLVIAHRDAPRISSGPELEALLPSTTPSAATATVEVSAPTKSSRARAGYRDPDDVSEPEMLEALRAHGFQLAAAAKALGISRTSLYTRVEKSPNVRKASDLTEAEIRSALAAASGKTKVAAENLEVSAHALKMRMKALSID